MVALREAQFDRAEELLNDALAIERQSAARPTHPAVCISFSALASLARIEADYPRAATLADEAADDIAASDKKTPAGCLALATQAALDADLGARRAIARYKGALDGLAAFAPPTHPYAAVLKLRLGRAELEAGNVADAEKSLRSRWPFSIGSDSIAKPSAPRP